MGSDQEVNTELADLNMSIRKEERVELLDSFAGSDNTLTSDSQESFETSSMTSKEVNDSRLNTPIAEGVAHGIDRRIHLVLEGSSSGNRVDEDNNTEQAAGNIDDLELQNQSSHLSPKDRVLNVLHHFIPIKQTYERISNGLTTGRMQSNAPGRFIGQGTDGVFRNLMAKPDTEESLMANEQHPPTYEEAAADAAPEYWESTVISPMYEDEVFVEGLPVGNIANFVWNGLVTVAFQFVGFVLCYLLHTSHAAKHGSRVGLGISIIIYAYGIIPSNFGHSDKIPDKYRPDDPNSIDVTKSSSVTGNLDTYNSGLPEIEEADLATPAPYFAYALIALGLILVLKAFVDYYRVKTIEKAILAPTTEATTTSTTENVTIHPE